MTGPILHLISVSCDKRAQILSVPAISQARVVEHRFEQTFYDFVAENKLPSWQVAVTELPAARMPELVRHPFVPIVNASRPEVQTELTPHLMEAISSAQLFLDLQAKLALFANLTEQELFLVNLASAGIPNKTICRRMDVSVKSVELYRRNAYRKLRVRSAAELARLVTFRRFFGIYSHDQALDTPEKQPNLSIYQTTKAA